MRYITHYTLLFLLTADKTPLIRIKHHYTLKYTANQHRALAVAYGHRNNTNHIIILERWTRQ
nr:MAG TPA: hypothetical protein [Caudoviricetes sp.]